MSCADANVQAIYLSMIPNLYRGHQSDSIPFKFTYACRLTFRGHIFPISLHVQLLYHYGCHLAISMVILLNYLPSDLQRSSTYYYRYIALLSYRGLVLIGLWYLHMAP